MTKFITYLLFAASMSAIGQSYTSYYTGNATNVISNPLGGICLMGGASEDDNAMRWFLEQANGGDILVLRTSGSDGYNNYLYSSLGVSVNSVETIVCNNSSASFDPYLVERIDEAEGIWFAGGNQWNYISYWRDTPVDSAIAVAIAQRNIVIGGTSAGMAIQGDFYFSAQNGTVTSASALANPYNSSVTVDSVSFIQHLDLQNTITDTHFDNPDRKGRLSVFLARMFVDYGISGRAIACDEYTAVCISNGNAKVYGGYPTYDDNAYFVSVNCELSNSAPEVCTTSTPLTWNHSGEALKVYQIKGTSDGSGTFDLNTWSAVSGGTWYNWSVNQGVFSEQPSSTPNCGSLTVPSNRQDLAFSAYPIPTSDILEITFEDIHIEISNIQLFNMLGQQVDAPIQSNLHGKITIDMHDLLAGSYTLHFETKDGERIQMKAIKM